MEVVFAELNKDVHEIIQGTDGRGSLYLGNKKSCADMNFLINAGIFAIISVTKTFYTKHPESMIPFHMIIPAVDTNKYNISDHFEETSKFIEENLANGKGVLVHCEAGISRSSTIVTAYLVKQNKMSVEKALEFIKSKRSEINPNENFLKQLLEFEKTILKPVENE